MALRVREDAESALSLYRDLGILEPDGKTPKMGDQELFGPGDRLPPDYASVVQAAFDDTDDPQHDHLHRFLEECDDEDDPYEDASLKDLKAEAERRGLEVEGTGADGRVKKVDYQDALREDDAKGGSAVDPDNPFAG